LIAAGFSLAGIYLVVIATIDFGRGNIGGGLLALFAAGCGFYFPITTSLEVRRVRQRARGNGHPTPKNGGNGNANS
jgi:hypothetical protein